MISQFPGEGTSTGQPGQTRPRDRRELPVAVWESGCGARLDYFGWRVTYCILDPEHVHGGSLHRSDSGINWCCNGKGTHDDDCVRLVLVPSVVG
jgi:hypothetical protein